MAVMLNPVLLQPVFECECRGAKCRCGAPETGDEIKPEDLVAFPRVLAVDPGTHTGWSIVWFDDEVLFDETKPVSRAPVAWWSGMVVGPEIRHTDYLMARIRQVGVGGEGLCVVVEDFIVRRMAMERTFLSPVRVTEQLRWALHRGQREPDGVFRHRRLPDLQSPSDAKSTVTDNRLKLWQMWLAGADHPRDATRHALLWLRRLRGRGEAFYDTWHFTDEEA